MFIRRTQTRSTTSGETYFSRERTRHFDAEAAVRIETASSHGVHLHKVLSDDAQEVRLYCFSEERAAKERGIVERFAKRFEDALTKLCEGLSKPRTQKRLDKVWQRIGRLKAQSRGIAQHYDIELDTDETGQRATAVRFTRRPLSGSMMTHPGVYCLRSNQTDWDEATLWRTYFTLTDLEAVFRSLKSELGLRPIYHHKPTGGRSPSRCSTATPPTPTLSARTSRSCAGASPSHGWYWSATAGCSPRHASVRRSHRRGSIGSVRYVRPRSAS